MVLYETTRKLSVGIRPEVMYWRQRSFTIIWTNSMYIINSYSVTHGSDRKLQKIFILNTWHPNAGAITSKEVSHTPPSKQEFCLPEWVVGIKMDNMIFENLEYYVLNRWWLDDPHHYPIYGKHFRTTPSVEKEYR